MWRKDLTVSKKGVVYDVATWEAAGAAYSDDQWKGEMQLRQLEEDLKEKARKDAKTNHVLLLARDWVEIDFRIKLLRALVTEGPQATAKLMLTNVFVMTRTQGGARDDLTTAMHPELEAPKEMLEGVRRWELQRRQAATINKGLASVGRTTAPSSSTWTTVNRRSASPQLVCTRCKKSGHSIDTCRVWLPATSGSARTAPTSTQNANQFSRGQGRSFTRGPAVP